MDRGTTFEALRAKLSDRTAIAGVVGLGYVGLPLAVAAARSRFSTLGFDIDPNKTDKLSRGESYISAVDNLELSTLINKKSFSATAEFARLYDCDVVAICVPTPLNRNREPDLSFIESTARVMAKHLRKGQLIVLESTTYPGTTREILKPILETSGLVAGEDFFVGFSPEREDPGNSTHTTTTIPKIVAGDGPRASELVAAFYEKVFQKVVPVSSTDVAEAVKITENVFRSVNIALVNELKLIYAALGIDIWEVIDAAKTKPFGYMPFYPGPGLGGHCIPIDPFYLTWKAREHDVATRFIELAGEINVSMPTNVVNALSEALAKHFTKSLNDCRILLIGLAYKKNVSDIRESPSLRLMKLLEARGATFEYHDPHVPEILVTREHGQFAGLRSVPLIQGSVRDFDAVLIVTDHDKIDYSVLAKDAKLIVDTRNVMFRHGYVSDNIVKA